VLVMVQIRVSVDETRTHNDVIASLIDKARAIGDVRVRVLQRHLRGSVSCVSVEDMARQCWQLACGPLALDPEAIKARSKLVRLHCPCLPPCLPASLPVCLPACLPDPSPRTYLPPHHPIVITPSLTRYLFPLSPASTSASEASVVVGHRQGHVVQSHPQDREVQGQ
jgi:hypothetical protein